MAIDQSVKSSAPQNEKNARKPSQHIGTSQDQVEFEDETIATQKLGDNKATAVPTSGAKQHKPENKNIKG
jgi:hypothetical protein